MRNKLAVMLTCKRWSALATELMYRTIILRKKTSLVALLDSLESNSERGMWIKGLFLYKDPRFGLCDLKLDDFLQHFPRLIRHCPNLRALVLDPQPHLGTTFGEAPESGELLHAIRTLSGLKFVLWYIPFGTKESMGDFFSSMSGLVSIRIENAFAFAFPDESMDEVSPPHPYACLGNPFD